MSPHDSTEDVIPYARQSIDESDIESVLETLKSDFVTQGPRIWHFEDALVERTGAKYAIAVSSGTAALHLACLGLGLKDGDVGVVPSITFAATANALKYCGAGVEFSDVDPESGLSSPEHLESGVRRIEERGERPKAILPVSYSGRVPNLEDISNTASKFSGYVIEDAAHSLGGMYRDSSGATHRSASCQHSDAAILSFHPVKHICAGEGGAVLTNDATLANRIRRLRSHGVQKTEELAEHEGPWAYAQIELGYNYRITDIQTALGYSQLKRLDDNLERRRELVQRYYEAFMADKYKGIFEVPPTDDLSAWHLYVIRFASSKLRRAAYDELVKRQIRSQVHYIPAYRHPYYKGTVDSLPGAECFYSGCLSLPLYGSMTNEQQNRVIQVLADFCTSIKLD